MDYTKCVNKQCRFRQECYRFMGTAGARQSYQEYDKGGDGTHCEFFMDMKGGKKEIPNAKGGST